MEARKMSPRMGWATALSIALSGTMLFCPILAAQQVIRVQQPAVAHSENFIVFAATPQWASQVSEAAEACRHELSMYWLGQELPPWRERCPIHVQASPNLGASGETTFALIQGTAGQWRMAVHGTKERILDSVLPHEITHTIFATHFAKYGKYVPRWADEGASTTVEHEAEKSKHRYYVHEFLMTGRGLSFNRMFSLKEYPTDILPLYAQGHSAVQFLLDQGGPRQFVQFLEAGTETEAWEAQLRNFYGYKTIGEFQTSWNQWLRDGSPVDLTAYAPKLRSNGAGTGAGTEIALAAATRGSTDAVDYANGSSQPLETTQPVSPIQVAVGNTAPAPVMLASELSLATDPYSLPAEAVGNEGWYKRRLLEVSGSPATPVPEHNTLAKNPLGSAPPNATAGTQLARPQSHLRQHTARPMPSQTPGIRVLDWGNRPPVQGFPVQGLQHAGNPQANTPWVR